MRRLRVHVVPRPDPVDTARPWFLLVLGSALVLLGLLLGIGSTCLQPDAVSLLPPAVKTLLAWGPGTFLLAGTALAGAAVILLSAIWVSRRS